MTSVLAIGIDPSFANLTAMPQFPPELVRAYLEAEISRVRDLGFEVRSCLIAPGEPGAIAVETALRAGHFSCVVIGAGLREPLEHLLLFEKILNLARKYAPGARIAFNTRPGDTAEAVQRAMMSQPDGA